MGCSPVREMTTQVCSGQGIFGAPKTSGIGQHGSNWQQLTSGLPGGGGVRAPTAPAMAAGHVAMAWLAEVSMKARYEGIRSPQLQHTAVVT